MHVLHVAQVVQRWLLLLHLLMCKHRRWHHRVDSLRNDDFAGRWRSLNLGELLFFPIFRGHNSLQRIIVSAFLKLFLVGRQLWLLLMPASHLLETLKLGILVYTTSYVSLGEHEDLLLRYLRLGEFILLASIHNDKVTKAVPHLEFCLNSADNRKLH